MVTEEEMEKFAACAAEISLLGLWLEKKFFLTKNFFQGPGKPIDQCNHLVRAGSQANNFSCLGKLDCLILELRITLIKSLCLLFFIFLVLAPNIDRIGD